MAVCTLLDTAFCFLITVLFLYSGLTTFTDGKTAGSCWRTTPWVTTNPRTSASMAAAVPSASARLSSQWVSQGKILPDRRGNFRAEPKLEWWCAFKTKAWIGSNWRLSCCELQNCSWMEIHGMHDVLLTI